MAPKMITLRDYQTAMIGDIENEYKHGRRRVCAVAPCGAGKTIMVGWMAGNAAAHGRRTLFLVHRQELIEQSSRTFAKMNILHGIIAPGHRSANHAVQIGSVQTVARRLDRLAPPDLIVIDEAHHSTAATWRRVIDRYPNAHVLGVTATPARLSGQGLGDVFESLVIGPTVRELIADGNLAPYRYYAPPVKVDLTELRVRYGDYVRDEIELRADKPEIIGDLVEQYKTLAPGARAICYCVSLAHSQHVAQSFTAAGIPAVHIDGETPRMAREQAIADFCTGKVKILCNVDLISEGLDVPAMEAVILARPTQSLTLYIQQAMRAMRPDADNPGKTAIIIDHVGNCFRHGLPDEDREWSLETYKQRAKPRQFALRQCPRCYAAHRPASKCPYCGYVYPPAVRMPPQQRDGQLVQIAELERKRKRQEVARARTVADLERIAIQRGYSLRWVQKMAVIKGIVKCRGGTSYARS